MPELGNTNFEPVPFHSGETLDCIHEIRFELSIATFHKLRDKTSPPVGYTYSWQMDKYWKCGTIPWYRDEDYINIGPWSAGRGKLVDTGKGKLWMFDRTLTYMPMKICGTCTQDGTGGGAGVRNISDTKRSGLIQSVEGLIYTNETIADLNTLIDRIDDLPADPFTSGFAIFLEMLRVSNGAPPQQVINLMDPSRQNHYGSDGRSIPMVGGSGHKDKKDMKDLLASIVPNICASHIADGPDRISIE